MTKRMVVCAVGAMFVAACSSTPRDGSSDEAVQQERASLTVPPVTPGEGFLPVNRTFDDCKLVQADDTSVAVKPHFVLRLPDDEGAPYGFSDGYSLPFPTPWLDAPDGGCTPSPDGCVDEPLVAAYENALLTSVPGIVSHQFLVYDLASSSDGFTVGDRQWFYNGTEDYRAVAQMKSVVASYAGVAHVDPHELGCVYVMQERADGTLEYSGYHAEVGQVHDPINWPDIRQ